MEYNTIDNTVQQPEQIQEIKTPKTNYLLRTIGYITLAAAIYCSAACTKKDNTPTGPSNNPTPTATIVTYTPTPTVATYTPTATRTPTATVTPTHTVPPYQPTPGTTITP